MKRCPSCKQEKSLAEFHKSSAHPLGVSPRCKPCAIEAAKRSYRANPDRTKIRAKQWAIENRERRTAIARRHYEKFKERKAEYRRAYFEKYKDRHHANWAVYNAKKKSQVCDHEECPASIRTMYSIRPSDCHIDHIIPISRGGKHCIQNLQFLTATQNLRKGASL